MAETTARAAEQQALRAASRYDFEIDPASGSTHALVLRMTGEGRHVLELGPATGYMTHRLREQGCTVVAIEKDEAMAAQAAEHAERMIVGDLETLDLSAELNGETFDVILAADVLEHLRDPLSVLRRLRPFLAEEGAFVISLPNVAHGSVRLALLEGRFPYAERGLLDETHLRFFTRQSVDELLDEAELALVEIHHQRLELDASEVSFDPQTIPPALLQELERDPDALTYQFVLRALPLETPGLRALQSRLRRLAEQVADYEQTKQKLEAENARLREENATIRQRELRELQQALAAISSREGQLRSALLDAHEQLLARDQELDELRAEILPLRRLFDRLAGTYLGRTYLRIRRLKRIAGAVRRRFGRLFSAARKL